MPCTAPRDAVAWRTRAAVLASPPGHSRSRHLGRMAPRRPDSDHPRAVRAVRRQPHHRRPGAGRAGSRRPASCAGRAKGCSSANAGRSARIPLTELHRGDAGRGQTPSSRDVAAAARAATAGLNARLELGPAKAWCCSNGCAWSTAPRLPSSRPICPSTSCPGLLERAEPIDSLYRVLADTYGVLPTNASRAMCRSVWRPTRPSARDPAGSPAFQVDRTTSDQHGRRIEYSSSVVRGDRYTVRLFLSRGRAQPHLVMDSR